MGSPIKQQIVGSPLKQKQIKQNNKNKLKTGIY